MQKIRCTCAYCKQERKLNETQEKCPNCGAEAIVVEVIELPVDDRKVVIDLGRYAFPM